jgi:protein-serine/threonine kinase
MNEFEVKFLFKQALLAIKHLHDLGIVHRDIKDENFLVTSEKRLILIDFGSAEYIKNGPFDTYVGTSHYEPPELVMGEYYLGKEQDMWQLGVLLYIMLFKKTPFLGQQDIVKCELRLEKICSFEALDLLSKLLQQDHSKRLTIEDALSHPFIMSV